MFQVFKLDMGPKSEDLMGRKVYQEMTFSMSSLKIDGHFSLEYLSTGTQGPVLS